MPKMSSLVVTQYTSDIAGTTYDNVGFKIRTGFDDCTTAIGAYDDSVDSLCPPSRFFAMRHLVATFDDGGTPGRRGSRIKFPVASPSTLDITAAVLALKACGAVCIDLVGEKWTVVPPSIGGYSAGADKMVLNNDGEMADKKSGRILYSSDAAGANQLVNVAYEIEPVALSNAIDGCVGTLDESPACVLAGIRPRRGIAKGAVVNADNPKATFSRVAPIRALAEVQNCISTVGNLPFVQCMGYQGESIRRVDLLFP